MTPTCMPSSSRCPIIDGLGEHEGGNALRRDRGSCDRPVVLSSPEGSEGFSFDTTLVNIQEGNTNNPSTYFARSHMFEMSELDAKWTRAVAAHSALEEQAGHPTPLSEDTLSKTSAEIERARFWATFEECAKASAASENEEEAKAFLSLQQRHTRSRGLTDDMVQNEVACIMQMPTFPYNLQQVVCAFSANAHPDWRSWDLIEAQVADIDADITDMTAEEIQESLTTSGTSAKSIFSLENLQEFVARMKEWRCQIVQQQPFQHEASIVASLRLMDELWSNYCLGHFRCVIMADYIDALDRLPSMADVMVSIISNLYILS